MNSDSICDTCRYCDTSPNKKPCNMCLQWIDGFLEATQYKFNDEIKEEIKEEIIDEN